MRDTEGDPYNPRYSLARIPFRSSLKKKAVQPSEDDTLCIDVAKTPLSWDRPPNPQMSKKSQKGLFGNLGVWGLAPSEGFRNIDAQIRNSSGPRHQASTASAAEVVIGDQMTRKRQIHPSMDEI
eukprot:4504154-Amphidinium_carterae.1